MNFRGMIILLSLLILVIAVRAQDELKYGVIVHEDTALDGYIFFAPISSQTAYLIDHDGRVIHRWTTDYHIFTAYLLPNGNVLMASTYDLGGGATGHIEERDWENNLVWEFDYPDLHHDMEMMPNGNILMLAWERFPKDEILARGLDPAKLPQKDPNLGVIVDYDGLFLDSVIEVNPATNEVVWRWAVSDHLVQDYDPNAPHYGKPSDFPRRIDLNYSWRRLPLDHIHLNSVSYNAERDQIVIVSHYYSEIWVIDHSLSTEEAATEAGDLLYRFGNPQTYEQGTEADRHLYLPHDAYWVNANQMMIFNNGQRNTRPFSTVEMLSLPETEHYLSADGFAATDVQVLYPTEPRPDFFARALSNAQLLPEEHMLISNGTDGRIFEVDANGKIVWDYLSPAYASSDPSTHLSVFRAYYYPKDYPAFAGKDLVAGDPLPLIILKP